MYKTTNGDAVGSRASRDSRESRVQGQVFINVPADLPGALNGSSADVAAARESGSGSSVTRPSLTNGALALWGDGLPAGDRAGQAASRRRCRILGPLSASRLRVRDLPHSRAPKQGPGQRSSGPGPPRAEGGGSGHCVVPAAPRARPRALAGRPLCISS